MQTLRSQAAFVQQSPAVCLTQLTQHVTFIPQSSHFQTALSSCRTSCHRAVWIPLWVEGSFNLTLHCVYHNCCNLCNYTMWCAARECSLPRGSVKDMYNSWFDCIFSCCSLLFGDAKTRATLYWTWGSTPWVCLLLLLTFVLCLPGCRAERGGAFGFFQVPPSVSSKIKLTSAPMLMPFILIWFQFFYQAKTLISTLHSKQWHSSKCHYTT